MPSGLTASQAEKFMHCHGAANLEVAIPGYVAPVKDPDKDNAANRGTKLHAMFAELMDLPPKEAKFFSEALDYVTEVRTRRRFRKLIEHTETVDWLDKSLETTADLVLYVQDELHIVDLKTGKTPVEVIDNYQLLYYAATYGYLAPKAKGAYLHIVQPWAGVMEEWFADASTIARFMADARGAHASINAGDVTFTPGEWCMFCPANPHARTDKGSPSCPAMLQMLYPEILDVDEILGG